MALSFMKKASSAAALQNDAAKMRVRRADLEKQLHDAQSAVTNQQHALEQALISGSADEAIGKAEGLLADAERRARALVAAICKIEEQISQREAESVALANRKAREQSAAVLDADLGELRLAAMGLAEAAKKFAAITGRLGLTIWDARELHGLAESLANEIPTAVSRVENVTRAHIAQVLGGTASPKLGVPEAPLAPKSEPIPKTQVFSMDRLSWREGLEVKTTSRHQDIELPVELAERALALGYVALPTDERTRDRRTGFVAPPLPAHCVDLTDKNLKPFKPAFGLDRMKMDARFEESVGPHRQSWINPERA